MVKSDHEHQPSVDDADVQVNKITVTFAQLRTRLSDYPEALICIFKL